jgi:hypothetical protein
VIMLAAQQSVQALTEQHHPRVKDEHAAGEEGLEMSLHGSPK